MAIFSSLQREQIIKTIQDSEFDLLVIGGGITGAGIALDAQKRGMKVALVEMQDIAAGTSSRSTKLVHGGLRYLKQFEWKLVSEVGKEREIIYENGPHVTTPEKMLLPFYKGGTFGPFIANMGLKVYDFLAGVKKSERRQMLTRSEVLDIEPLLKEKHLKGGGYYVEYKTDDARLTLEVIKKSVELGATAMNYIKMTQFLYDEHNIVNGIVVQDQMTKETFQINAKRIINATGPWVDILREMDGSKEGKRLFLTKGAHLVFSQEKFPLRQAVYFDTDDQRMIFAIPKDGKTYVGTTDTEYHADIAHPDVTEEDELYLLNNINHMFPSLGLEKGHIESVWAGLRPLIHEEGKSPSEISRKDEIFISPTGLYSIAGGKLTGYRKMAEDVVDEMASSLEKTTDMTFAPCTTKKLPISGGDVGGSTGFMTFRREKIERGVVVGLSLADATKLTDTYGSNVGWIFELYGENRNLAEEEGINPVVLAMLLYAMTYEMTMTPVDFFTRRTGATIFDVDWVAEHQQSVINFMTNVFSWDDATKTAYGRELMEANQPVKI